MAFPEHTSLLDFQDRDATGFYDAIRTHGGPAFWDERMESWLFADYERVLEVSKHEELFGKGWGDTPGGREFWGDRGFFMLPPDEHWQFHKALSQKVKDLVADEAYTRERLRPLIHELVDEFSDRGAVNFSEEFANRMPLLVIMDLMGVSPEIYDACRQYNEGMAAWILTVQSGLNRPGEDREMCAEDRERIESALGEAREAMAFLRGVLMPIIEDRRDHPGTDLVSSVWEAGRSIADDWSEIDVLSNCNFLFGAGNRTTARALANVMYMLVTHGELYERILKDRSTLEPFIEEVLRLHPSTQLSVRIASQDLDLGEAHVREGESVHVLRVAANRDPEQFECPADIDVDRPAIRSHVAFGVGRRSCIGAPLARHEIQEAFEILLDRLPNLRVDDEQPEPQYLGLAARAYAPVHVRFDPTPAGRR